MSDALRPDRPLGRLFAFLDVGGRPDGMEGLVEPKPRIEVARKFIGLGNDCSERLSYKSVAVVLAAGESARIAAQEWQVRSKFLAKGHSREISLEIFGW